MGGSVMKNRKGLRSRKSTSKEPEMKVNQGTMRGGEKQTSGQSRPATAWLKD